MNEPEAGDPPTAKEAGNATSVTGQRRHAHFEVPKGFGADYSFLLPREHWLRRRCIQVVSHNYFDRFIILAIVLNSIILGLADFSVVGDDLNPASTGKKFENGVVVDGATSTWNLIVEKSETPFAVIFAIECALKVLAMGFIRGKGSYLNDSWNRLDFVVVLASTFTMLPAVPSVSNVSSLRTIRVLRPLRSLSVIPGMRRLISALLKALPALGNVVLLQVFVFFIFGILGIQLFGGSMNRRCRTTEFPVRLPLNTTTQAPAWPVPDDYMRLVEANASAYRCFDVPLLDYEDDIHSKETSPWNTPQACFWPVDESDERLCSGPGKAGVNNCTSGQTCGSNYDAYGNPRFNHTLAMNYPLNTAALNWGYTRFDDIGMAFFTIFQSITQEGWTVIMYMVMDSSQPLIGVVFFVVLIIFASFFVMNLTLAVISEEFNLDESPRGLTAEEKKAAELKAKEDEIINQPQRSWLTKIVSHRLFSGFIMTVILGNTAVLSLDHHPMPDGMDADLETANFALSCVFVVEMVMKLGGLGLRQYARDKFNLFDAFIVTMGILETMASPPSFLSKEDPTNSAVSALRAFRLFRVFKLARDWRSLRELLEMIVRAVASIGNFAVLLVLFIYIYGLIGVQFFGNSMRFDEAGNPTDRNSDAFWNGTVPRNNFDTLLWSVITVFQVITGENWNSIMYDAMRGNSRIASIYFISLVIMGDFVLMNLFLALLLDNFGSDDEEQAKEKEEETKKLAQKMSVMTMKVTPISETERAMTRASFVAPSNTMSDLTRRRQSIAEVEDENVDEDVRTVDLETFADEITPSIPLANPLVIDSPPRTDVPRVRVSAAGSSARSSVLANARSNSLSDGGNGVLGIPQNSVLGASRTSVSHVRASVLSHARGSVMSNQRLSVGQAEQQAEAEEKEASGPGFLVIPPGKSLLLFSEKSRTRQWAFQLSIHPLFDKMIFGMIVWSSIALAVDNPLSNPDATVSIVLKGLDKVFAVIFTLEMLIKIIALGLVAHKGSYLRNGWNVIDCVIVISSLVMLAADAVSTKNTSSLKSLHSLRSLRTFRAFRPLRMISRRPGLKLVVNALIEAIPEVLNVFFLCMLLYLIFSIIAVNSLKGTFNACSGELFDELPDDKTAFLVTPKPWSELLDHQREWFINGACAGFLDMPKPTSEYICKCWDLEWSEVIPENFDNVLFAMLTLFEISTTEGWADVMMAAIDATGIGMQPIRDHNMNWAFFFVAFLVVGSFFVMNLFVGVIIDNFNRMKAALGGDFMLTPEQKKWIEAQKTASRVGPVRILKPPRHRLRRVFFNIVKLQRFEWFIMICIIVNTLLMSAQYFGESTLQDVIINIVNEVLAGVFTLEAVMKLAAYGWGYFNDQWNQFDFFVVVGTLVSIVIEMATGTSVRSVAMLVRVFRVARILRLVKASKSIRQIMQTLYIALPGLSNITSILFLLIFLYTTMGVQMFSRTAIDTSQNLNSLANFQDFGKGFLFLLRAATGEAWNSCMHDYSRTNDCEPDRAYNSSMCGFNNFEGCVPLDGCGTPMAYLFFCTFTLMVTYVMLNLTIAVILESFSQSHEDEEPLFEPELLEEFQTKWADIDPKATGFVKAEKLLLLVNILKPPLGRFGMPFDMSHFFHYMSGLELPMYRDETVNFKDVLLAMTREMVKGTMAGDPSAISEIGQTHDDEFSRPRIEFFAHQFYAIRRIQRSVTQWLHTKRQLEKKYMEEYKNKIKKPSGRPKKQRDARVFTIG